VRCGSGPPAPVCSGARRSASGAIPHTAPVADLARAPVRPRNARLTATHTTSPLPTRRLLRRAPCVAVLGAGIQGNDGATASPRGFERVPRKYVLIDDVGWVRGLWMAAGPSA
jgi:hypothetical protein